MTVLLTIAISNCMFGLSPMILETIGSPWPCPSSFNEYPTFNQLLRSGEYSSAKVFWTIMSYPWSPKESAYDKYQGKIKYENIDLELINKDNLRRQIGVVPQNPLLFNGSIRDNLSSDKHFDDKQLYDVLKKVALLDFIKSLPMGIDTIVSENGFNLSGGQKQRLALARAILDKKTVLFLDEATSSLDNITEREVVNHLDRDAETKVVIAHRLSTIKKSDKIIVMKDGMISEVGTHYELMSKKGEYYKMYIDEDSQYT